MAAEEAPKNEDAAPSKELLKGVFSRDKVHYIGFGDTRQRVETRAMIYVEEQEDGSFLMQALNEKFLPSGESKSISRRKLLDNYLPEPAVYHEKVYPVLRKLVKTLAKAERHRRQGETYSAEYEFKNALRIDEYNIRATFGLGLTYLDRGDSKRGEVVFRRVASLKAAFEQRHKHMFNEFGIMLRKNGMFRQALKYYGRAYKLSKDDEHLLYNIARTLYEKGKVKAARNALDRALKHNPEQEECLQFLQYMKRKEEKAKRKERQRPKPRKETKKTVKKQSGVLFDYTPKRS